MSFFFLFVQSYRFLMSALEGYRIHLDQKDVPQGILPRLKSESAICLNSITVNTRSGCTRKQTCVNLFMKLSKVNLIHNSSTGPGCSKAS